MYCQIDKRHISISRQIDNKITLVDIPSHLDIQFNWHNLRVTNNLRNQK